MKKQSLDKINQLIKGHMSNDTDMIYRNIFATACYLSTVGKDAASQKLLKSLLDKLGWQNNKTYFLSLLESISQYAPEYAKEINANSEINSLFH